MAGQATDSAARKAGFQTLVRFLPLLWPRGEAEPAAWTLEVPHKHAHQNGCPGLFGFSPQDMRVYIDNILVTAN